MENKYQNKHEKILIKILMPILHLKTNKIKNNKKNEINIENKQLVNYTNFLEKDAYISDIIIIFI